MRAWVTVNGGLASDSERAAGESQVGGVGLDDDDAGSTETLP